MPNVPQSDPVINRQPPRRLQGTGPDPDDLGAFDRLS
jgi:hypothetical protein